MSQYSENINNLMMQKLQSKFREEFKKKTKQGPLFSFFFSLVRFSCFDPTNVAAKQSLKFTCCYNGGGHRREPCAAPVQHQRAENKARTVRAELTRAYIILDCNLRQPWKRCIQTHRYHWLWWIARSSTQTHGARQIIAIT